MSIVEKIKLLATVGAVVFIVAFVLAGWNAQNENRLEGESLGAPVERKLYKIKKVEYKNAMKGYGLSEKAADKAQRNAHPKEEGIEKMQPDEFSKMIAIFNVKQGEIIDDCDNDTRCKIENGKKKVVWQDGKNIKFDFINLMNYWIAEDQKNSNAFKK